MYIMSLLSIRQMIPTLDNMIKDMGFKLETLLAIFLET
jgi:hypothetical protein